ncbi:MAG: hypothetical protein JWN69_1612 [Alphaproteobacteria bacterium]|nr:hypothetical protein [Alphaproteobacteria bacterium]
MKRNAPPTDNAVPQSRPQRKLGAVGGRLGERLVGILGAVLFQVALFYALLVGLRFYPEPAASPALAVFDVAEAVPPPAHEPPKARPKKAEAPSSPGRAPAPVAAPQPVVGLPIPSPVAAAPTTGQGAAVQPGAGLSGEGAGQGAGSGEGGAVRAQRLRGSLHDRDYPPNARREGAEGVVYVRFAVGTDGRASGCTVTRSSGHAELDTTTCTLIERRFRYLPARDPHGRPVPDTVSLFYTWGLRR